MKKLLTVTLVMLLALGLAGVAVANPGQGHGPSEQGNENQRATENVPDHAQAELPFGVEELITIPEYGEEQMDFFQETTLTDPFEVVVELDEEVTETLDLSLVRVTDHLGEFGSPTNALSGPLDDVEFEDGVGSFTIQGSDTDAGADLDMSICVWFGSPCEPNEIDTIEVELEDYEVVALYLTPESIE